MKTRFGNRLQSGLSETFNKKSIDFAIVKNHALGRDKAALSCVLFSVMIVAVIVLFYSIWLPTSSVFAQGAASTSQNKENPLAPQGNTNTAAGNTGNSATFANINNNTKGAILEKVSDKGNYRVQIMWNQSSLSLPKKGFDMEIDFLNASAPLPSAKTIPPKDTGIKSEESTGASASHVPVPSVIQPNVPVDSYDITIYSDHGKVLWNKANQAATGGRGLATVKFGNGGYTGPMTIQITKIKSGNIPPNSVTFSAKAGG
ncbi:MAG TPA: hypothetical protein VI278_02220 [Nitrososphaeraceae archaeon]